jgi:tetratricopeptide (TPR) repeat protein
MMREGNQERHVTMRRMVRNGLVAAVAGLALGGCSESYRGERLFWKARQVSAPITQDPEKATPEQYEAAARAFQRIVQKTPGTVWAARAQLTTGSLYAAGKQYEKAREHYQLVLQNYHQYTEFVLNARLSIAKTYELEQNIDEAINIYDEISELHPWSQIGQAAPLYVAYAYEQQGRKEEATRAYERAVRTFTKRIPDAPNPELQAKVRGFLAHTYQRLGDWDEAVRTLEGLIAEPGGVNRPLVLLTLGAIYETKLSDRAKARTLYEQLVQEFPEHPLGNVARTQIEKLFGGVGEASPAAPIEIPDSAAPAIQESMRNPESLINPASVPAAP